MFRRKMSRDGTLLTKVKRLIPGEVHADVNAGAVLAGGVENLGSDTSAGFLLSAGLNYKINNHLKAYGEYKYTDVSFEDTTSGTKYDFDLDTSSLMFGVSYHF